MNWHNNIRYLIVADSLFSILSKKNRVYKSLKARFYYFFTFLNLYKSSKIDIMRKKKSESLKKLASAVWR